MVRHFGWRRNREKSIIRDIPKLGNGNSENNLFIRLANRREIRLLLQTILFFLFGNYRKRENRICLQVSANQREIRGILQIILIFLFGNYRKRENINCLQVLRKQPRESDFSPLTFTNNILLPFRKLQKERKYKLFIGFVKIAKRIGFLSAYFYKQY